MKELILLLGAVLLILVVLAFLWLFGVNFSSEPRYNGKTLTGWRVLSKTGRPGERSHAVSVLLRNGDDSDFYRVIELLYDDSHGVKESAFVELIALSGLTEWNCYSEKNVEIATRHIRTFLYDDLSVLRKLAIRHVYSVRDRGSIWPLLDILRYDRVDIKSDSARALKKILDKRDRLFLPMLLEAYELNEGAVAADDQDLQKEVRKSILDLIVNIENLYAVPKLLEILDEGSDKGAECLSVLTKKNFGTDVAKWRDWWNKNQARILKEESEKNKRQREDDQLKERSAIIDAVSR